MKLKTLFLFLAFVCSGVLLAEDYKVELFDVKTVQTEDSVMVTSTLQVNMEEMPTRNQLRFTPVLAVDGKNVDFGPVILLNGKKQHHIYKCKVILDERKSTDAYKNNELAYEYKGGEFKVAYHGGAALEKNKSSHFKLYFRQEMVDSYGDVVSTKMLPIENSVSNSKDAGRATASRNRTAGTSGNTRTVSTADSNYRSTSSNGSGSNSGNVSAAPVSVSQKTVKREEKKYTPTPIVSNDKVDNNRVAVAPKTSVNEIVQLKQNFNVLYKGSYLQPAEDAIYERNQKELRFSLEEAKVIAEINPNMLSLRELFAVAQGYTDRSAMFHKIIKISVDLYPSNPIANLNAAASAIELGNIDAAATYLQVAPHDTLAYTNCRGAYELMRNNVQEGLRLLKAASAAGSTEADENLKIFFGSFKK